MVRPPAHGTRVEAQRLALLDVLRAAAILLVMLHHFRHLPGAPEWLRWVALRGYVGVDLFFVLSGWLVGGQVMRAVARGRLDPRRFWFRRWMRTLPVYYVVLGLWLATGWVSIEHPVQMVFFVQNYTAPLEWLVTWSLCIEEHYYLVLPLVIAGLAALGARSRKALYGVVGALVLFSLVGRALAWPGLRDASYEAFIADWYGPTHLRLDGLVLGTLLAAMARWKTPAWRFLERHAGVFAVLGLLLVVGSTWNPWATGFTADGVERMGFFAYVPAFFLVSVGVALTIPWCVAADNPLARRSMPRATFVSEHAYTLYLTHLLARSLCHGLLAPLGLGFWPELVLCFAAAFAFAMPLRWLVEQPGLRLRDRVLSRDRVRAPRPSPLPPEGGAPRTAAVAATAPPATPRTARS